MRRTSILTDQAATGVLKCPTGILGLDEILEGGLPRGRPTLVVGAAGCGKTVLGMEFAVRGILDYDEPALYLALEERRKDLDDNFASMGFDLPKLQREGKLRIDHIEIDPSQIAETGDYNLEALFVRLQAAIDAIGAKRVVLDTLEVLFAGLHDEGVVRSELRRLFIWLKDLGMTTIVTAERGASTLTRHGLEEYVADCVIVLENNVEEGTATRRLRVLKYRGSAHGANLYPFLMDREGISVLPITSLGLDYAVSNERFCTGIDRLDTLLGGGVYRGSSVLISGTAGSGKTSFSAAFAEAAASRGESVLYLAFEESPSQIVRNMASIGIDLRRHIESGLLRISSSRPTSFGLETHLAEIHRAIVRGNPSLVIVDPVSNFISGGTNRDTSALLARLLDLLKSKGVTAVFTSLTHGGQALEATGSAISSMMDTWLLLRDVETDGERNRVVHVLKSRGFGHSNQVREFQLTNHGIKLMDVYTGSGATVLGSARLLQEAQDEESRVARMRAMERQRRERERRHEALEARIAALRAEFAAQELESGIELAEEEARTRVIEGTEAAIAVSRRKDITTNGPTDPAGSGESNGN